MTQTTEHEAPDTTNYPYLLVADVAEIYRNNGFKIINFDEYSLEPRSLRTIRFSGDCPDEGRRAARFAKELGFYLFYLRRVWNYDAGSEDFPYWELVFCTDTVSKDVSL